MILTITGTVTDGDGAGRARVRSDDLLEIDDQRNDDNDSERIGDTK